MTRRKNPPTREEVDELAQALAHDSKTYARQLRHYLNGESDYTHTVPVLRLIILDLMRSNTTNIRSKTRLLALQFGSKHGTYVRRKADEILSVVPNIPFTPAQWDVIKEAAAKAGMSAKDYVRNAAIMRARKELDQ